MERNNVTVTLCVQYDWNHVTQHRAKYTSRPNCYTELSALYDDRLTDLIID